MSSSTQAPPSSLSGGGRRTRGVGITAWSAQMGRLGAMNVSSRPRFQHRLELSSPSILQVSTPLLVPERGLQWPVLSVICICIVESMICIGWYWVHIGLVIHMYLSLNTNLGILTTNMGFYAY